MDSERVLTVQHRQEVGPCGVLCLFGVIKEDVNTLMVLLKNRSLYKIKKRYKLSSIIFVFLEGMTNLYGLVFSEIFKNVCVNPKL